MSQHTPGPWTEDGCTRVLEREILHAEMQGTRVATIWAGSRVIAFVFDTDGPTTRLITAAPEMVEMLLRIQAWLGRDNDGTPCGDLDALLAKIEGKE